MSLKRRRSSLKGDSPEREPPSLENLVEAENLGLEILHPGGAEVTRELAALAAIVPGTSVLDVAAGTGETARLLATEFGARITTVDVSPSMIERQRRNLSSRRPAVEVVEADAHELPFRDECFDVALSECAVCHFDQRRSIGEMARVVRPGGRVGIHDLCWKENAPDALKRRLLEIEQEAPGTIGDWIGVFESAGLDEVRAFERPRLIADWMRDMRQRLGLVGYLAIGATVLRLWGVRGLRTVLESERIFASPYLGYVLVIGVKR